ncbi:ABC transporter substrate-binding protein [Paenibacillus sp. J2TS4]|uniref:ABC transporter substrate-binding protein n=1 Tax=Paenibacillus sp. J2TS4 TaxID=2807194 RepID=UPI001B00A59D|nr:sugar ABC transporter substrate-binding protein [Paenibacillus sp. J2TS4]GIP30951.1 sugar ABC transporter [Paenibacillus sp. J2TS4]
MKKEEVWKSLVVFTILLSVVFTGCSKSSEENEDGRIVLEMPHWFFGHGGTFEEWIDQAIQEFEAQNPNIKINGVSIAYDDYWNRIDTSIAANNAGDIMAFWSSNLGKYIDSGAILPLDDYINMDDINNSWSPLQKDAVVGAAEDGKTYLLAINTGFYLPMYRPSVLEAAGVDPFATTPEEFIEMSKKLTKDGSFGFATMIQPGNWAEGQIDLAIWTIGMGGHYGQDGKPTLNSPEVIQAVEYLKALFDAGVIPKETDKGTYRKMMATGNVGTIIDGSWMYALAESWDPSIEGDYEVAELPFPTQNVASFYEGLAVSSQSKHPEEAAKFIEFLGSPEQQKKLVDITGVMPGRNDIFEDEKFKDDLFAKWPWFEQFIEHADTAVSFVPEGMDTNKVPEMAKIWYSYFERVLYNNMDVTEAMNAAQEEALALFN